MTDVRVQLHALCQVCKNYIFMPYLCRMIIIGMLDVCLIIVFVTAEEKFFLRLALSLICASCVYKPFKDAIQVRYAHNTGMK